MSTTLAIITPIIHRNGDTRDTLLDQLKQAYSAVRDALDALQSCAGNGRGFIQDPGRLERYARQHRERYLHLKAVLDSLQAEAIQIQEENRT